MTEADLTPGEAGFTDFELRYEKLRQNHLDGVGGWAMSVFLREGMCGWIRARIHPVADTGSKKPSENNLSKMNINDEAGKGMGELVGLIASMTLTKLKGV